MDILFINPATGLNYQGLKEKYSAIEPPTWILLLANSMRNFKLKVDLIDVNAENLSDEETLFRVKKLNPKIIVFVVYGQNVNAGTTNMEYATALSKFLKSKLKKPIAFLGSYVQALPKKTLEDEDSIDIVFTNEGVYALKNLLHQFPFEINDLKKINGIAFRDENNKVIINPPENIVKSEDLDKDLPGYAWDLLPFKNKPLDMYRSPMWHAEYDDNKRSPYAAIQTSLGCQFKCTFCMINLINRNDSDEVGVSSNYSKMRFWSPDFIIKEFEKLINLGVKTIKITDEMFLLNKKYYIPLCEKLAKLNTDDSLNIWAYSRVDTIKKISDLEIIRKAGIKWLALGIESADKTVRLEVTKGKFEDLNIKEVIRKIHSSDIQVMANYIFGLPGDTEKSIKKTFELSVDLETLGWNTYAAMALPGSALYKKALDEGIELPQKYSQFSFHSYDTIPLSTQKLTAFQILKLRDDAFIKYHTNKNYLQKIKNKFGKSAYLNILDMCKIKLKRKIIEENKDKHFFEL